MSVKRITIMDNEAYLRQRSEEIDFSKDNIKEYIAKLDEYFNENLCYAMASIQIGIPKRLIYIRNTTLDNSNYDNKAYNERKIMINPVLREAKGLTKFWEGCVSCGDNCGLVFRPYSVVVEYYDENNNFHVEKIEGFPATVFCHEYDHLNGILHMDKAKEVRVITPEERKKLREKEPYQIISKNNIYKVK